MWVWHLAKRVPLSSSTTTTTKSNLKRFPPCRECVGRGRESVYMRVCAYWGVRGGGLEGEKGGGGDKRALSALLILYFTSGGCGALSLFPALWVAFTVRNWMSHKHTDTLTKLIATVTFLHIHTHNTHTHFHTIVFLSRAHTHTQTLKVAFGDHCMPRQTAYYHTVKHAFQRQNKTICSEEKKE